MTQDKNTPIRTCIGCGAKKVKYELVRLVADNETTILIDEQQKLPGRGAYICKNIKCLTKAYKKNKFHKALRHSFSKESVANLLNNFTE